MARKDFRPLNGHLDLRRHSGFPYEFLKDAREAAAEGRGPGDVCGQALHPGEDVHGVPEEALRCARLAAKPLEYGAKTRLVRRLGVQPPPVAPARGRVLPQGRDEGLGAPSRGGLAGLLGGALARAWRVAGSDRISAHRGHESAEVVAQLDHLAEDVVGEDAPRAVGFGHLGLVGVHEDDPLGADGPLERFEEHEARAAEEQVGLRVLHVSPRHPPRPVRLGQRHRARAEEGVPDVVEGNELRREPPEPPRQGRVASCCGTTEKGAVVLGLGFDHRGVPVEPVDASAAGALGRAERLGMRGAVLASKSSLVAPEDRFVGVMICEREKKKLFAVTSKIYYATKKK